jgi:hypothetical protein
MAKGQLIVMAKPEVALRATPRGLRRLDNQTRGGAGLECPADGAGVDATCINTRGGPYTALCSLVLMEGLSLLVQFKSSMGLLHFNFRNS